MKLDLNSDKNHLKNNFNCKNISHVVAELFYLTSNALSSQEIFSLSNFYINLSKYLNQNFLSYNSLLAENFMLAEDYQKAKKIFQILNKGGDVYSWHSTKQLALIDVQKNKLIKL